ncbi:MAG: MATE family efflux transporter [Acutalibacteraceae bacterium]|nr:MATE family efflux transporter [Acutalibacteraceae bacterium]
MNSQKSFFKNMLKLALPIAMQQLLVSCAQLIDTAMVTNLGNTEVSAVGVSSRWIFLMNLFYFGISSGSAAMIAQFWGAKEKSNIRKSYGIALIFGFTVAAIFTTAMFSIPETLIKVFTGTAENQLPVIAAATDYIKIVAFMAPFAAFNQISCVALRSTERVNPPLFTSIAAVAVNTSLNFLLINGNFGFPKLGIRGAAVATLTSTVLQSVLLFIVLRTSKDVYNAKIKEFFTLTKDFFRRFSVVCMPVVLNEVAWAIGTNIYAMVFARQGEEAYAGYTIFSSIEQIAFVFFVGICHACSIMTGKTIGEGNEKGAYKLSKKFLIMTPIIGVVTGTVLFLIRNPLLSLLDIETQTAFDIASLLIMIYCLWLPFRNIPYTLIVGTFRAGGDTKVGIAYDMISLYLLGVPVVAYLGLVAKVDFGYLILAMYLCEDIPKIIMSLYRFKSKKWIRNLTK